MKFRPDLDHAASSTPHAAPAITIFSIPRAFRGHIGVIQRNALQSWTRLRPRPQVILFGDDEGTADAAKEFGLDHVPEVQRNELGTPLMDGMFRTAHELGRHGTMTYINCDILLLQDFLEAAAQLECAQFEQYLMIGRRIDTNLRQPLNFSDADWETTVREIAAKQGSLAPRVCKDYFLYRKPLYAEIPPFAIGRSVFDNWLVFHARQKKIPVVDATRVVTVVHQNHTHAHVLGGKGHAYLKGEEAKRNRRLAGGIHLVKGSTATWLLTSGGVRRRWLPSDLAQFLMDLPLFLWLVLELYGWKSGYRESEQENSLGA